jgi:small subunit ribosomal protein S1
VIFLDYRKVNKKKSTHEFKNTIMSIRDRRKPKNVPDFEPNKELEATLTSFVSELQTPPRIFQRGQIVNGEVVQIGSGEILINVGGRAEGVVSGREMKLDGEQVINEVGQEVMVYVVKGENEKGQIELSIRRTGNALKWSQLRKAQENDEPIKVKAIEANTGGLIVDVGGGLRGFIPTSQLDSSRIYNTGSYSNKVEANTELQTKLAELIGSEIEVKIIEIDREKNRVIFSEKMVTSGADLVQRKETLAKADVGTVLDAEVTGIAPFGLFVNAEGLEGLVHLSEISWDKVSNPADFYKVGDKVRVQIIGIQDGGKRVAYSIKRMLPDPWDKLVAAYEVGQIVEGEVTKVVDYGAFVRIGDGLNGLIHISELSDKLVRDPGDIVEKGKEYKLMIISISKDDRHLGLSLKRIGGKGESAGLKKREGKEDSIAPEMERLKEFLGSDEESDVADSETEE